MIFILIVALLYQIKLPVKRQPLEPEHPMKKPKKYMISINYTKDRRVFKIKGIGATS